MKHLLPILTVALLGAATTASAEFYYDYYQDIDYSDPQTISVGGGNFPAYYFTDDYSYGDSESRDFKVARNSNWYNTLSASSTSNFYRIHVLGNDVNLYLTDFVDNVGSPTNENALINRLDEYGYRKLELVDGKYVPVGETEIFKLTGEDAVSPTTIDSLTFTREEYSEDGSTLLEKSYTVDRYKYDLGTFSSGDVIEVYMKDKEGGIAYSYADFNVTNEDGSPIGARGGFGDGGYLVNLETDEMLNGYYFQDEPLTAAGYHAFEGDAAREAASAKAMPLSALDPSENNRVYFGIIGMTAGDIGGGGGNGGGSGGGTSGAPLPGGLEIALAAVLFGLGFWYFRRRKAMAA